MKLDKVIIFLNSILLISLLFISGWLVYSFGKTNHSNSSSINSVTVNMSGFDIFTKGEIDPLITDEKKSNELIFDYNDTSTSIQRGWYYLSLADYGNCTDFELSVNLELNYSSSTMFGHIKIIFGGFYDSQNQFVSNEILPITMPEKSLLMVGIEDLIDDGAYMISETYINDSAAEGMGWFDDGDRENTYIIEVERVGEGLDFSITGCGGGSGTKDLDKILNYIIFMVEIHGSETSSANVRFFSLVAELECSHLPTTTPSLTSSASLNYTILLYFSGLIIILLVIRHTKNIRKT